MRIAFVSNAMGRGGAEIQVRDYALRLVARGHEVLMVSLLPFEDFEDELRAAGVQTATMHMTKGQGSLRALGRLVRTLTAFRAEVVHAHMFAAILATRAARACLVPMRLIGEQPPIVIGTAHTPFEANWRRYLAYRASDAFSDLWTCVCQEGVDTHESHGAVPRGQGVLTANGIDLALFTPDAAVREAKRRELGLSEAFVWFTAGSFRDEQKDYSNLLHAFAKVVPAHPEAHLVIAGAGRLLEDKRRVAATLGIGSHVHFLGLRSDMTALLNAADAFVLGSAWEAMPIVLLEAAAMGLPTVCTRVGQNADIVIESGGFVVPQKDASALGEAMARVTALPKPVRQAMGDSMRLHVAGSFDLDVIVAGWEQRYSELLAGRGHARRNFVSTR